MRFGRLFKQIRKDLDVGQEEMSRRLKITQGHLSKIEASRAEPSASIYVRLWVLAGRHSSDSLDRMNKFCWRLKV